MVVVGGGCEEEMVVWSLVVEVQLWRVELQVEL